MDSTTNRAILGYSEISSFFDRLLSPRAQATEVSSPNGRNAIGMNLGWSALGLFRKPIVIATTIQMFVMTALWGGAENLARDLRGRQNSDMVGVIVQYRNSPSEANHQNGRRQGR